MVIQCFGSGVLEQENVQKLQDSGTKGTELLDKIKASFYIRMDSSKSCSESINNDCYWAILQRTMSTN